MSEFPVEFNRVGGSLIEEMDFRIINPGFWGDDSVSYSLSFAREHWGTRQFCEMVFCSKQGFNSVNCNLEDLSATLEQRFNRLLDFQEEMKIGALNYLMLIIFDGSVPVQLLRAYTREAKAQRLKMDCWLIEGNRVINNKEKKSKMFIDSEWISKVLRNPQYDNQNLLELQARVEKEENIGLAFKSPVLTYFFLGINLIVFLMMTVAGGSTNSEVLIAFGAKYNPLIVEGEYWRFVTPMFLHIGVFHLLFNSYALYNLGPGIEGVFGRWKFLLIYLFAGATGSLASFYFSNNISAGASGAIFGLLGAFLYFGYKRPKIFARGLGGGIITALIINLVYGFTATGIDNFAHLGGLFGGLIIASVVGLNDLHGNKSSKRSYGKFLVGVSILGLALSSLISYAIIKKENSWEVYAHRGEKAMHAENYPLASTELEKALALKPDQYSLRISLAYSYLMQGYTSKGREQLEIVLRSNRQIPEVYFNLALIAEEEKDYDKALEYYNKVLELDPEQRDAQERLRVIRELNANKF